MGVFGYWRRRRERESAISVEQLAELNSSVRDASATIVRYDRGRPSLPGAFRDAFRYRKLAKSAGALDGSDPQKLKDIQDSVMEVMDEHGIDPSNPDPKRLMEPEVQRALRCALLGGGRKESS